MLSVNIIEKYVLVEAHPGIEPSYKDLQSMLQD